MKTPENTPQEQEFQLTVFPLEIDPNLPESKRKAVLDRFVPIYKQIQDLEDEYAAITQSDVTVYTPKLAKRARALRLTYVSLRGKNGLKGAHSELKEASKLEGQVIDKLERDPREFLQNEREAILEEIEKHEEREEARRVAELHEERLKILSEYNAADVDFNLGEMTEEYWEEYFNKARAAFQAEQERLAKEALSTTRKNETSPYSLLIPDYNAINWAELTEKRFKEILSGAKSKWEQQEKERIESERKIAELEKKAEEERRQKAEIEARFVKRVSLVKGAELQEDGMYYKGKKIATMNSIRTSDDGKFQDFLSNHMKKYSEDVALEQQRKEAEEKARQERLAAQAKIEAEAAAQRAAEERARQEAQEREDRLRKQKEEELAAIEAAKEAPDSEKLLEFAKRFAAIEVPEFRTEKGISVAVKFHAMREKWLGALEKIASEMER